jgi:hypothetical protein
LEKSKKIKGVSIAHSFSIIGVSSPGEPPQVLDYYPDIKEKPHEFMYIHSIPTICYWQGKKERTIEYTLTDSTGAKRYLTAFVYEGDKAMALVSEYPMFSTQK